MSDDLESRLRRALHALDRSTVGPPDGVWEHAHARLRSRHRRRTFAVRGAVVGVFALAAVGLMTVVGRDVPRASTPTNDPAATTLPGAESTTTTTTTTRTTTPTPPPSATTAPSSWRPIAPHPGGAGWDADAVWMGDEAFVLSDQGYAYDPAADQWRALAPFPAGWTHVDSCQDTPATCLGEPVGVSSSGWGKVAPILVWTGEKVLVVGGDQPAADAAVPDPCPSVACAPNLSKAATFGYVPATDSWQALASPPWFVTARSPHAWTGTELLVWPWDIDDNPDPAYAYSPAANTWRRLADVPIVPRQNAASVWTGTEWIVWGGGDDDGEFADGAAYDPETDTWRALAPAPIEPRKTTGVWTGEEMVVMAGSVGGGTAVCCGNFALGDGAAYDPATDSWRPLRGTVGHPGFELLWAEDVLLMFAKGGVVVYDPAAESYIDVCCAGMAGSAHIWTGNEAISFGSFTAGRGGGIFTPP